MLRFGVLGPLEVADGDRPVAVAPPKERALLAVLLMERGRAVTTDRLIDLLWGDAPPKHAVAALQYHVSHLRDLLEPGRDRFEPSVVVTVGGGYALDVDPDQVDAARFEDLCAAARAATDVARAAMLLQEALGLWRGPPYADFGFDEFAQGEIRRLEELRLAAEEDRIEALLASGRAREAVADLGVLTHDHPLRERLWGLLMTGLYRVGRQAEALAAYQEVRRLLGDELGVEPSAELVSLEERILLHDPSLNLPPHTPQNLPNLPSSFVDREADSDALARLVGSCPLVTVTGPGGVGKSRLTIETARSLVPRFEGGVWLVELASVSDPALVPRAVVSIVDVAGRRPEQSAMDRLVKLLTGRNVLLLLDTCEHLIQSVATMVGTLLARLPSLRIVATSREPLRVPGEVLFTVDPLAYPDPAAGLDQALIAGCPAIELFCERAGSTSGFRLTAENTAEVAGLCARLDGLPLALELAAAQVRVMAPAQLLERLERRVELPVGGFRTAPPRHQSLEAAIEWSHEELAPPEQAVLRRLAVFAGGFDHRAAEHVCTGRPVETGDVLTILARLVDRSLVATRPGAGGEVRYRLLEQIRDFAWNRLAEAGETVSFRRRHASYFVEWSAGQGGSLRWPQDEAEMRVWRSELDNVRAALAWALDNGRGDIARVLAGAAWRFWLLDGASSEGLDWLQRSLAADGPEEDLGFVVALRGAGGLAVDLGRWDESQAWTMRAIDLAARLPGDEARLQLVSVLGNLGDTRMLLGDHEGADSLFREARRLAERLGHPHLATIDFEMGWNALCLDDLEGAGGLFARSLGGPSTVAKEGLWGLAIVRWLEGDIGGARRSLEAYLASCGGIEVLLADGRLVAALLARDEARPHVALDDLAESLRHVRRGGGGFATPTMLTWWLLIAATVHAEVGNTELAPRIAGAAVAAAESSRHAVPGWQRRDLDGHLRPLRIRLGPAAFEQAWQEGSRLTVDQACLAALRAGAACAARAPGRGG